MRTDCWTDGRHFYHFPTCRKSKPPWLKSRPPSKSENNKIGAKRGAKSDGCPRPRTKVKAIPRETISEKKFKENRRFKDIYVYN